MLTSKTVKIGMKIQIAFNFTNLYFTVLKVGEVIKFANMATGEIHSQNKSAFDSGHFVVC